MKILHNKKVLTIAAHPDDEVISLWPVCQDPKIERYLLTLCDNSEQGFGDSPRTAIKEICKNEDITLFDCLSHNANFYALGAVKEFSTLALSIQNIWAIIDRAIKEIKPDYIFTHNVCGEYGHPTHKLVWDIVSQHRATKNLIFTDISFSTHYHSYEKISSFIEDIFYQKYFGTTTIDLDFYNRCRAVYKKFSCWTWNSQEPKSTLAKCNLCILKNED